MEMTYERAAEILDPEHLENYDSLETVKEACRMGMDALKKRIPIKPKLLDEANFGCPASGEDAVPDAPKGHRWESAAIATDRRRPRRGKSAGCPHGPIPKGPDR